MTAPALAVADLRVRLARSPHTPLLRGVSLTLAPGEVHGVVGESGAGKSTIGKAVLGILPRGVEVAGGTVMFDGTDLLHASAARRRAILGDSIALVPQDPSTALNPARRIGEQVGDGLRLRRGLSRRQLGARVAELLADVRIAEPERVMRRYPHELSGGMRQRALIAAAFALEPKLIIADEPTSALDVTVQKEVLRLLRAMQAAQGTAVLFVTHDLGVVAQVTDRVTVLFEGAVVEQGETARVLAAPAHPYTAALLAACPRHDVDAPPRPIPAALTARLREDVSRADAAHG